MKYKIIWSKRAVENLKEVYEYIGKDSLSQANKVVNELIACVEPLKDFPYMGVKVREFPSENIREIVKYSYRIVYCVSNNNVQIITVIHSRQNFKTAYYR